MKKSYLLIQLSLSAVDIDSIWHSILNWQSLRHPRNVNVVLVDHSFLGRECIFFLALSGGTAICGGEGTQVPPRHLKINRRIEE